MGGHGGLNILPQKRWNVYNFDNREKVRKDEEAAAREEHVRQQQQRLKDSTERLSKLRDAALTKHRGGASHVNHINSNTDEPPNNADETDETLTNVDETLTKPCQHEEEIQHMKLFHGLVSFKKLSPGSGASEQYKGPSEVDKKVFRGDKELERLYKRATKEATRVGKDGVEADDEHYKLGYGCLDRNRKRPWYLMNSSLQEAAEPAGTTGADRSERRSLERKQKKTIAELREERLKREQQERQRAYKIIATHEMGQPKSIRSSEGGRRPHYNQSFGNAR